MLFEANPTIRRFATEPDKEALVAPLQQPTVGLARLKMFDLGSTFEVRWVIPWAIVWTVFGLAVVGVTVGLLIAALNDAFDPTLTYAMLGMQWLLIVPTMLWVLRRALLRAMRYPCLIAVAPEEGSLLVIDAEGEQHRIPFDNLQALVTVGRAVPVGAEDSKRWGQRTKFSILYRDGGEFVQVPLFGLLDEGRREEDLRKWMLQLPRLLGCDRVGASLGRSGQIRPARELREAQ